jgi:DNA-binding protein Fis
LRTKTSEEKRPLTLEELEAEHLSDVLEYTGGNKCRAAALLGIDRRTLHRKLKAYELQAKANQVGAG